jgi:Fe2+ transport system protein FeoA
MNLSELKNGEVGVIISVNGKSSYLNRFLDFGITVGKKVRKIKKAPFGDPILFEIENLRVGIRKEDARLIEVKI